MGVGSGGKGGGVVPPGFSYMVKVLFLFFLPFFGIFFRCPLLENFLPTPLPPYPVYMFKNKAVFLEGQLFSSQNFL